MGLSSTVVTHGANAGTRISVSPPRHISAALKNYGNALVIRVALLLDVRDVPVDALPLPRSRVRLVATEPESARARTHQHFTRSDKAAFLRFKASQRVLDFVPGDCALVVSHAGHHLVQRTE